VTIRGDNAKNLPRPSQRTSYHRSPTMSSCGYAVVGGDSRGMYWLAFLFPKGSGTSSRTVYQTVAKAWVAA
jgi:hypothetical protein